MLTAQAPSHTRPASVSGPCGDKIIAVLTLTPFEASLMAFPDKPQTIRLLIVDDDEGLLDMMRERFDRKGIKLATAPTGEAALTLADREHFDIALLDLGLPDIGGLEVLARFKERHPEME